MTPQRVTVFCDWQNIYRRARGAFTDEGTAPSEKGQVSPVGLASLLVSRGPDAGPERHLEQVRIYRGMPNQDYDQRGYDAARSQHSAWSTNRKVELVTRPIQYPADWRPGQRDGEQPREKGVDVSLAVDLATMSVEGAFDVAIVFSSDNDILPAVEFVARRNAADRSLPTIEVAAWSGNMSRRRPSRLNPRGFNVWCHWLNAEDYSSVEDSTRYPVAPASHERHPVPRPPRRW